jgi:predicted  nucleic acid-binding Zn-ribbon protein
MAFDEGNNVVTVGVQAPDFSAALEKYTEQVQEISVNIKTQQSVLDDIKAQIVLAQANLQAQYKAKISDLDNQITSMTAQLNDLQNQHQQWLDKIKSRQAQHDNISLNFSNQQDSIENAWVDFHQQVKSFLDQSAALTKAQSQLSLDQITLQNNQSDFEKQKAIQQADIDQKQQAATQALSEASAIKSDALSLQTQAQTLSDQANKALADLDSKVAAAQPVLAQADEVAKQKAQNDIDAKNNAAQAIQNQEDGNQIKVAKVALNNQQQEYNSRMQTLQQAEAALKGG